MQTNGITTREMQIKLYSLFRPWNRPRIPGQSCQRRIQQSPCPLSVPDTHPGSIGFLKYSVFPMA